MFTFACASVEGLTTAQKRETIKALRESIKLDMVAKRSAKIAVKSEKAEARAAKKVARIEKLQAKLAALTNPVGTKAIKANRKPSKVTVTKLA